MGAGFWIYLGAQVLNGNGLPFSSSRHEKPQIDGGGCTALTIDRHNSRTTASPCPGPGQWLRDALTAQLARPVLP